MIIILVIFSLVIMLAWATLNTLQYKANIFFVRYIIM